MNSPPHSATVPPNESGPNNPGCLFCPQPDKITEWHYEDDACRVIDKPSGEPMVVLNEHAEHPSANEMKHIETVLDELFVEYETQVLMNHVKEHWHAHILEYEWRE